MDSQPLPAPFDELVPELFVVPFDGLLITRDFVMRNAVHRLAGLTSAALVATKVHVPALSDESFQFAPTTATLHTVGVLEVRTG